MVDKLELLNNCKLKRIEFFGVFLKIKRGRE